MKKLLTIIKLSSLTIALWLIGFILFMGTIYVATPQNPDQKTDALIVLTGGQNRIETGLDLFQKKHAPDLFITGVYPTVKKQDIIQKWKQENPLPVCCITLGYEATTTTQNAAEVEKWLSKKHAEGHHIHTIRLITADFHMNRAIIEFTHKMPDIMIIPHPISQPDARPQDLWYWIVSFSEYNKTLYRWISIILTPPKNSPHNTHGDHS